MTFYCSTSTPVAGLEITVGYHTHGTLGEQRGSEESYSVQKADTGRFEDTRKALVFIAIVWHRLVLRSSSDPFT